MTTVDAESQVPWMKQDVRNGLVARLARDASDILAAQRLRYQVFFEELGAKSCAKSSESRLDQDRFDAICDHVLVIDQRTTSYADGTELPEGRLVGTYRLLRHDVALANGGFYSAGEYDLAPLLKRHPEKKFLEVGRSCVAASHRGKAVAELLWQGIWDYTRAHRLDVMLGCASLTGTDPGVHAEALAFLHYTASPTAEWQVRALPHLFQPMDVLPADAVDARAVLRNLPILIKAYLRLGSFIGEGAVVDHAFNTTDVLVLLPVSRINPKYFGHYGAPA